ncbi:MAG: selenide, water dikinase SelD [Candidatus Latescibacteria bacterium]|nr:selenide, water dikinase SelD [bacterium]MBD3425587.1 selenide, water dikinase SelD [Candidatus Latescibacterota bacterium]
MVYNSGGRPGHSLILTKPLGTGIYSTALKNRALSQEEEEEMYRLMSVLNRDASELMCELGAGACTDITGYGLVGHALEMAQESGVTLEIDFDSIPFLPSARRLADEGFLTGGGMANLEGSKDKVSWREGLKGLEKMLLCDPQTSGGLLVSLDRDKSETYLEALRARGVSEAACIGRVAEGGEADIIIR